MNSQFFDKLSDEWWDEDGSFKALHSFNIIRIDYIRKKLPNDSFKGLKILDIGCGGGILCEPLSRLGACVTGIDTNKKAIQIAKDHAKKKKLKISYKNINIDKINMKNFDIITCMEVLEHVENFEHIISKSKNILKKNGLFFGSTINKTFASYIFALFFAEKILKIVPRGTHDWNKLVKPNYLKKVFLLNGFSDFQINGTIYNPFNNLWRYTNLSKINYMFSAFNSQ